MDVAFCLWLGKVAVFSYCTIFLKISALQLFKHFFSRCFSLILWSNLRFRLWRTPYVKNLPCNLDSPTANKLALHIFWLAGTSLDPGSVARRGWKAKLWWHVQYQGGGPRGQLHGAGLHSNVLIRGTALAYALEAAACSSGCREGAEVMAGKEGVSLCRIFSYDHGLFWAGWTCGALAFLCGGVVYRAASGSSEVNYSRVGCWHFFFPSLIPELLN